ncbi:MAG: 30S ribosomal protein S4 [Candidatus Gottesmanbacteria bacterium GW2011_GWB1_43_11]|uniref:Small ribosomal subunit protein uS4 n=1 Tax=Candidatus Gottesmanbacteria bacterium GW2011_GWB1_43_11 TaxID=1618446 RepID=A0A0G1FJ28_9BACT|nr:MAG: 30S ribosomal protein S4 [Candidatus Gottesmanbacteria bacterium GW2011_GWA2_42_16]KKS55761.1 MAG: 30S ribosomal protein S4 [Candidatus Gottesmanbacteria bacterium GW2011_GWA1_42_26]KKS81933.1 MAG: SSU ribosomal protein S4P, small subunit ribosomal protein S4 [Candidatus Gottesmanbacteria bacterium GW2011_GWC1_43_10]KKS86853.1 MAG: 30S ribosomal protein S4 [Candidatus Gottesmanbacteria bacterium GW2011_GWB1_43_11]OGG10493.1 MAG: 30S ribosomal protein S4 [Candidatus Gottesmanbacteria bac
MARYTGPKNRLARREGVDLGLKTPGSKAHASLLRRLNLPPGQHGPKGKRKPSDYALQLREKQKARRMYGLLERQFRNYYKQAMKVKGNTGDALIKQLEMRLDNILYRLGLAPTRAAARQFVTHGHTLVNNQKMSFPSYQVQIDDVVTLKPKGLEIPAVKKLLADKTTTTANWLERKGPVGKVLRKPERSEVASDINEQLIVEYYSR